MPLLVGLRVIYDLVTMLGALVASDMLASY